MNGHAHFRDVVSALKDRLIFVFEQMQPVTIRLSNIIPLYLLGFDSVYVQSSLSIDNGIFVSVLFVRGVYSQLFQYHRCYGKG